MLSRDDAFFAHVLAFVVAYKLWDRQYHLDLSATTIPVLLKTLHRRLPSWRGYLRPIIDDPSQHCQWVQRLQGTFKCWMTRLKSYDRDGLLMPVECPKQTGPDAHPAKCYNDAINMVEKILVAHELFRQSGVQDPDWSTQECRDLYRRCLRSAVRLLDHSPPHPGSVTPSTMDGLTATPMDTTMTPESDSKDSPLLPVDLVRSHAFYM